MSHTSVPKAWKIIKPHLPLIKFKKGGVRSHVVVSAESNPTQSGRSLGPSIGSPPRGSGIDESQLPKKYQRKPISQLEMEMIERGGPDTL